MSPVGVCVAQVLIATLEVSPGRVCVGVGFLQGFSSSLAAHQEVDVCWHLTRVTISPAKFPASLFTRYVLDNEVSKKH